MALSSTLNVDGIKNPAIGRKLPSEVSAEEEKIRLKKENTMSKDTLKYNSGNMENTAFADQFIEILQKQGGNAKPAVVPVTPTEPVEEKKVEAVFPAKLTDLIKSVEVSNVEPTLDEETVARIKAEIEDTKEGAKLVGVKLFEIRETNIPKIQTEIRKLESLSASGLSSVARESLAKKRTELACQKEDEKKLLGFGNDAYRERAEYSYNLIVVQKIEPDIFKLEKKMIDLCTKGYCRLATPEEIKKCQDDRKWPEFTVFAGRDEIYFMGPATKTDGQRKALSLTLRSKFETARLKKAAVIRERGDADLGGFPKGVCKKYLFCAEEYIDKEGKKHSSGVLLAEIYDRNRDNKKADKPFFVLHARDAEGSLSWAVPEKNWWIPFSWIEKGYVSLPKEKRDELEEKLGIGYIKYAEQLIRKTRALYAIWEKGLNPKTEVKVEDEPKSDEPLYSTPSVDMTDVVVAIVPALSLSLEEVIEKVLPVLEISNISKSKVKKAKKATA